MKTLHLTVLMTLLSLLLCTDPALEWTDPVSGTRYDFSALKKDPNDPWKIKDGADNGLFSMIYYFNFGTYHNKKCKGQIVSVTEVLEVLKQPTDTCEILGRGDPRTVGLIDQSNPNKGIYVQYGGGDKCTNGENPMQIGKPRQTKFTLNCAASQDDFKVNLPGGTQGTTKCMLEFTINTPAGCPGGAYGSSKSTVILIWIILLFSLYMILGTFYNIKQNNMSGKEAIPNIEFWRSFPMYVQEGMSSLLFEANKIVGWVRGKISGNNSSYNDI